MTMHSVYYKEEHEGAAAYSPIGHLSSSASVPWWTGLGTQVPLTHPPCPSKSFTLDHSSTGGQFTHDEAQLKKRTSSEFTIFPGNFSRQISFNTSRVKIVAYMLIVYNPC